VKSGLLLDVVVGQSPSVFELFACEDQSLLVRRDALLVLDLGFNVLNSVRWLNLKGDGLSGQCLHKDLHTSSQSQDKMKCRLLLDVVVGERPSILQLFTSKDQPLLVWRDAFFILDLGLHVLDGVRWLNFESDGLAGQRLHKDLHTSSQPQDEVKSGLLLDVVVGQSPSVFELFACEDQSLLVRRDALLVLDLGFNVLNSVRWLNLKGDGLSGQCLHKDLHTSSQSQDKMKCGLLLDVVVGKCPSILQLFTSEDQSLLVWRDAFLVLNLSLHVLNGVRRLDLEGDSLPSQCLHKDLHTSSQPQDKMEGGLLLDVIVRQSPTVLQLFTSEDQPLLIWRDALLILNLGLNVLDGVRWLNFEGDGFTGQCLHENLHTSSEPENKMEGGLLLDVVVGQSPSIFQLFTSEDQSLLVWGNSFLILDLGLHVLDGV